MTSFRIERSTLPVRTTCRCRQRKHSSRAIRVISQGRWCIDWSHPVLASHLGCSGPNLWCEINEVVFAKALSVKRCGLGWKWLCWRRPLTWSISLRYRSFFNWPDRLPRYSIEHEHKALFRDQSYDLAFYSVDHEICEYWCRGIVPVPDIVVDCLKVPHTLTGFRIQAHDAGRKKVVSMPMPTVVVTGGSFCRQVNKTSFRVM